MNKKKTMGIIAAIVVVVAIILAYVLTKPFFHYRNGMDLLEKKNYSEALEEFRAAGNYQDAEEKAEYSILAISFTNGSKALEAGDYAEAITQLVNAKGFPNAEKKLKEAANLAFENQDWQAVTDVYLELPEYEDSQKWYAIGRIEEQNGNYQDAIKQYEKALGIGGNDRIRYCEYQIGITAYNEGDYQTANEYFKQLGNMKMYSCGQEKRIIC